MARPCDFPSEWRSKEDHIHPSAQIILLMALQSTNFQSASVALAQIHPWNYCFGELGPLRRAQLILLTVNSSWLEGTPASFGRWGNYFFQVWSICLIKIPSGHLKWIGLRPCWIIKQISQNGSPLSFTVGTPRSRQTLLSICYFMNCFSPPAQSFVTGYIYMQTFGLPSVDFKRWQDVYTDLAAKKQTLGN